MAPETNPLEEPASNQIEAWISLAMAGAGLVLHVSPSGRDESPGTEEEPLRTLTRARDLLRELRPAHPGPSVVFIKGVHYLDSTFLLRSIDGGTRENPVLYVAGPGEAPLISAGVPLADWRPVTDLPMGVPEGCRGKLWSCPWNGDVIRALFDETGLLERAAGLEFKALPSGKDGVDGGNDFGWSHGSESLGSMALMLDPGWLLPWHQPGDFEVAVSPLPWIWNALPVAAVDRVQGRIAFDVAAAYNLSESRGRFENVPEGLTGPGTWWHDRPHGRIYLWPRRDGKPTGVVAPGRVAAVRIEGMETEPVRNVWCHGLTFAHGDRPVHPGSGKTLIPVHDWEFEDADNALVHLRHTADTRFSDCLFARSGASGLRMDGAATGNRVSHCAFEDLGNIGLSLVGKRPGQGDVHSGNEVAFNRIRHAGRITRCAPGFFAYQSGGNHIHDNLLEDLPYSGIVLFGDRSVLSAPDADVAKLYGGNNLIEHNEVTRIMQHLGDGTGIYLSATPSGNRVLGNHVHHVERQVNGGVRTDDLQSHALVAENLIHDLNGFGIILKHVNVCRHNVVVDCRTHISVRHYGPNAGSVIEGNILAQYAPMDPVPSRYEVSLENNPYGPFFSEYTPVKLDDYEMRRNILFCPDRPDLPPRALSALGRIGKDAGAAVDPGFLDHGKRDFRLADDSPARAMGFPQIPQWGPRAAPGPRSVPTGSR